MKVAGVGSILGLLVLSGCGASSAIYSGPGPDASVAVLEGYSRFWGAFSERAEITRVDRLAKAGIVRATLGNVTRAQVEPGDRCVELEIKTCTVSGCGEPTACTFANYFVAGQHVQLKAGSLKRDTAKATMQIEVSAPGFKTVTRRIDLNCGPPARDAACGR